MKHLTKFKTLASGAALSVVLLATSATSAYALSGNTNTVPPTNNVSGTQAKAPVEPGTKDAKTSRKLGPTSSATVLAGTVAGVDFQSPLNYCYKNLVYTPVKNTTAVAKSIKVILYNQGGTRTAYYSVAANSTSYPAFYNTEGAYTAQLYVRNGTSYQYDEYTTGTNTCNVSVTRVYNAGGWVELKIQNLGTAYATVQSTELAPYSAAGTYTGTHYDYPAAGGAAIYRWFQVGTSPYGIVSDVMGSSVGPFLFYGDL